MRWLQELLYQFHQQHLYTTDVPELCLAQTGLKGVLAGKHWEETAGPNYREVKAATYHQLRITQDGSVWEASVILDV